MAPQINIVHEDSSAYPMMGLSNKCTAELQHLAGIQNSPWKVMNFLMVLFARKLILDTWKIQR